MKRISCKECGSLITIQSKSGYCLSCIQKGNKNSNYIDGRTNKKYYCKDCEKELSCLNAKRCRECYKIYQKTHSSFYKDGKSLEKYYCIDCNKKITYQTALYGGKRCNSCATKEISKIPENSANYKNGWTLKTYYCIEKKCNKIVSGSNKRCRSCACRVSTLKKWQDIRYRNKTVKVMLNGLRLKPNKKEIVLNNLLQTLLPKEYKYVGDGEVILGGFNPDFINTNGQKKIIEMFGDYWHNILKVKKRDKQRLKAYKSLGYKTLIIWEHELDKKQTTNRILNFN